jgi:hypothetical protein
MANISDAKRIFKGCTMIHGVPLLLAVGPGPSALAPGPSALALLGMGMTIVALLLAMTMRPSRKGR